MVFHHDIKKAVVGDREVKSMHTNGATVWTSAPPLPEIGAPFMGGFFAGIIDTTRGNIIPEDDSQAGLRYALIAAPPSQAVASMVWSKTVSGYTTRWDGLTAGQTHSDNVPTHINKFSYDLLIDQPYPDDGGSPWYIPALDEAQLMHRNLKPVGNASTTGSRQNAAGFPETAIYYGDNPSSDPVGIRYSESQPLVEEETPFHTAGGFMSGITWTASLSSLDKEPPASGNSPFAISLHQGFVTTSSAINSRQAHPVRRLVLPS